MRQSDSSGDNNNGLIRATFGDIKTDSQVFFVSLFTKFIGHIYMVHGIVKPGDPINRVSKDLIWMTPSIAIVALFANDIGNSKIAIFKKAKQDRFFDNLQISGKFSLGVVGFVLSFCPTRSLLDGMGGMSGGLYVAHIIINVVDKYRKPLDINETLNDRQGQEDAPLISEQDHRLNFCVVLLNASKDALKIIPRGAAEALLWGLLLNWQPETYQPFKDFCDDDELRLLLLSSALIAVGSSSGFPTGGMLANLGYWVIQQVAAMKDCCVDSVISCCSALAGCCSTILSWCTPSTSDAEEAFLDPESGPSYNHN